MEDKLDKGKTCQKQASLSEINFLPRLKAELHGYLLIIIIIIIIIITNIYTG